MCGHLAAAGGRSDDRGGANGAAVDRGLWRSIALSRHRGSGSCVRGGDGSLPQATDCSVSIRLRNDIHVSMSVMIQYHGMSA